MGSAPSLGRGAAGQASPGGTHPFGGLRLSFFPRLPLFGGVPTEGRAPPACCSPTTPRAARPCEGGRPLPCPPRAAVAPGWWGEGEDPVVFLSAGVGKICLLPASAPPQNP